MKIYEIVRPKNKSPLNEIIEFDEVQYGLEMLTDVLAVEVKTLYYFLAEKTKGFTIPPKTIFDADDIEDMLFDVSHYYDDYKCRLTECHQSLRMLLN
jgi:hypothetical protein